MNAVIKQPPSEKPTFASPLGFVPKRVTNKLRLTGNMRYMNRHLEKKVFKFEGLGDLADMAGRENHTVSYDPISVTTTHVCLHPSSRTFVGFS